MSEDNLRDVEANDEAEELLNLGYFDQGFEYYAVLYREQGKICCRFNENPLAICRFIEKKEKGGDYCGSFKHFNARRRVPSGMLENVKKELRQEILAQLKEDYPPEYWQIIDRISVEGADSAAEMFGEWKKELMSCFDSARIEAFRGLLAQAYYAKVLTQSSFAQFMDWSGERLAEIMAAEPAIYNFVRTLSGYFYLEEGEWLMDTDADFVRLYERRLKKEEQGRRTSPIYSRDYHFKRLTSEKMNNLQKDFSAEMRDVFDERYMKRMNYLLDLPSVISADEAEKLQKKVAALKSEAAVNDFRRLLLRMNCAI